MFAIIILAVAALVALMVFGFVLHVLFSPWLLLAAVGVVAWIKFRPSRSR
jgi:ABC-type iron transport system FetAB permease component